MVKYLKSQKDTNHVQLGVVLIDVLTLFWYQFICLCILIVAIFRLTMFKQTNNHLNNVRPSTFDQILTNRSISDYFVNDMNDKSRNQQNIFDHYVANISKHFKTFSNITHTKWREYRYIIWTAIDLTTTTSGASIDFTASIGDNETLAASSVL